MRTDGDWLLGIEIGGTKLQLGMGPIEGGIEALELRHIEPANGASGILDQIEDAYQVLLERMSLRREQVRAAGVGFGGPVDVSRGRIQTSYQVEGWSDFPLAEWLRSELGICAVAIENDADTAGLAEAHLGAGKGFTPLLYLTIGSGIGGALVLNGEIYRGCGLGALEIGHVEVVDPKPEGFRLVQLEQVASGWGIGRRACETAEALLGVGNDDWVVLKEASGEPSAITALMVSRAAMLGDPRSAEILDRARRALAFALRQAIALVAPRRIILGGGVSLLGEHLWFEPIRNLVADGVFAPFRNSYDIVPAALGQEVVVHGALVLARAAARADR